MLKKFFFNMLSAFMGAWVALVLFGAVAVLVIVGVVARLGSDGMKPGVSRDSVLEIVLGGVIEETESPTGFSPRLFTEGLERPTALSTLVKGIAEAKVNKGVKALYLNCQGVVASPATLNALRQAVADFKKSGKKVYAYGDNLSQGDYFVAAQADSLFLNPDGALELHGIGGQTMFYKDLLDKLGVRFTVCKVGTYKSAVEPYISPVMSAPARAQLDTLYGNMWSYIRAEIASARGLKPGDIESFMARGMVSTLPPQDYVKAKLVDRLIYTREIKPILARLSGTEPEKLNLVNCGDLSGTADLGMAYGSKRQVAVLYATGEIAEGTKSGIDCAVLVPEIVKLAEDDHIKALVLRVNSPGGSVFGSSQIGEALAYFKSKGKPFAVSMGDYAASGGYWISCDADRIFADPLTITGSIGIFGLLPDLSGLLSKVGLNVETVETDPASAPISLLTAPTASQIQQLQTNIERGYDRFVSRVAEGRHMKKERVLQIAEGRVWDGRKAKTIGLVDEMGSLDTAVAWAAKQAELKDNYDVAFYPQYEPSVWDKLSLSAQLHVGQALDEYLETTVPQRTLLDCMIRIVTRKPEQARALETKVVL